MKYYIPSFVLFSFAFVAGFSLFSSEEAEYRSLRNPAAIQSSFDISHLSGNRLELAQKDRLLSGLEFQKSPESTKIQLGHFIFTNENGQRVLACEQFQTVTLTFEAEGVSVAGDKPVMEVTGLCTHSPDMSQISSLFIPVNEILNEVPTDSDFSFIDNGEVSIRFINLADEWPRLWLLRKVQLQGEAHQPLLIESDEVAQLLGHPVVLRF